MKPFTKTARFLLAAALTASLLPAAAASAAEPNEQVSSSTDQIILKVKAGKDGKLIAGKHGAKVKKTLRGGYQVLKVPAGKTAEEMLANLQRDADVETAELDEILTANYTPNDPSYGSQWHLNRIIAPDAWNIVLGAPGVTIAVVDTGVDYTHPDLSGKMVPGYNFVTSDPTAMDDSGHGTHLAGIIAASVNNGTNGSGVDPNARIMPVKVLDRYSSGYTSTIIEGIYFAADNGAKVINLSLGGGTANTAFQTAVNYAFLTKNAVVVASAGNNGTSTVQYPAGYPNVISVACTTPTDAKCAFSNYGTWVDVAAPGQSIYSTKLYGGMTTMSGTSMAAAVTSGVAGLTWSDLGTGVTAQTVANKIFSTSDRITGTGSYWNYGRVNAYRAVTQ